MSKLDFIIIGAAKSATTTLHELIQDHPDISMPREKEVPFFSDNRVYKRGVERYMKTYFKDSRPELLNGTATPQYMIGQGDITPADTARRIHDTFPNVKIIAVLRHPIERAFSHYRMLCRNGHEDRTFDEAVSEILSGKTRTKRYADPDIDYILGSKYGEVLSYYYKLFPKKNILILTTEGLRDNPAKTLSKLFDFLGVSKGYQPKDINKQSRVGGGKPKVKLLTPGFMYRLPFVKFLWQKATPAVFRKKVEYHINLWNTKPDKAKLDKDGETYKKLVTYFRKDINKLEKLTEQKFDWL